MTSTEPTPQSAGRPRSKEVRDAILQSTLKLIQERSPADVTIKSIAEEAKVGRQTIYRWWRSRGEVVLEALLEISDKHVGRSQTGSPQEAVAQFLVDTVEQARSLRRALAVLMIDAQVDLDFLEYFRSKFVEIRRSALIHVLEGAVGDVALTNSEKQFISDMVYGPLWYRLLVDHAPLSRAFADQLTGLVLDWLCWRKTGMSA